MPLPAPTDRASKDGVSTVGLWKQEESPSLILSALAEMKIPPWRMLFSNLSSESHLVHSLPQAFLGVSTGWGKGPPGEAIVHK